MGMACPLCNTKLDFKQINFNVAVLICTNINCPYPIGGECVMIERNSHDASGFRSLEPLSAQEGKYSLPLSKDTQTSHVDNKQKYHSTSFHNEQPFEDNVNNSFVPFKETQTPNENVYNQEMSNISVDDLDDILNELIKSN